MLEFTLSRATCRRCSSPCPLARISLVLSLLSHVAALGASVQAFGPELAPPGLKSVWGELTPMIASAMESGETELEVRFGMEPGGIPSAGFPNGVPPEAFERVANALRASAEQGHIECLSDHWELQRDLCYSTFLRETMSASGERKIIRKQLIKRIDVVGHGADPHPKLQVESSQVKMRFSWKTEQDIPNPTPADFGQLEGVREKQRLSFRYKMWRFDLTIVRGAPCFDFRLVDSALAEAPASYEIELELCAVTCPPSCPPAYLAHSLLLKAQDITALLLPSPDPRPDLLLLHHHAPLHPPSSSAAPAQA